MLPFLTGASAMFAAMYSTQAILPELSRDFGVSPASAGLTVSLPIFALALGVWFWGPLSDRIGRRSSVVLASGLLVIPSVACAVAPVFEVLLVARVAQGLCMPGLVTAGVPYVGDTYVPRMGAQAMGYYLGSLVAGGLIGRVGVGLLAALTDWRIALGALTLMPVLATVTMWRSLPREPGQVGPVPRFGAAAVRRVLVNRRLAAVTVGASALFFGFVATFSYVDFRLEGPPFLVSPAATSLVFLLWLFGFVGPLAGRIADRRGWRQVAAGALLATSAGMVIGVVPVLPVLVLGLAVIAAGAFAGFTAFQLGLAATTGPDRGLASAMYYSVYYLAGAAGGFVPGLAWERWGWPGVTWLALASFAIGVAALLGELRSGSAR